MHTCRQEREKVHTLIVEDNEADVRLLEIMMKRAGSIRFFTQSCDSVAAALEHLAAEHYDIVILDLGLTDSQGLDSIRKILAHHGDLPFVVLTGLKDEKLGIEAVRLGAQDYMVKGEIDTKSLIRTICYAIERKEAEHEQRSLRAQLLQAQKMEAMGTLASGMAHDFNNILAIVRRNFDIAKTCDSRSPAWRSAIDSAESVLSTGSSLINRLLQFGKPARAHIAAIDLNETVSETLAFLRALIPASIRIEEDLTPSACTITIEPATLSLLLTNLCINARDAMPRGGVMALKTRCAVIGREAREENKEAREGSFCVLTISDTGMGIPCTIIDRIFEPFFTTKEEGKGSGLGLSMVYSTMKNLGGWLQCRSTEGQGTEFTLYFPEALPVQEREPLPGSRAAARPETGGRRRTVLFADDSEILLLFGRKVLEENGFSVLTARDGEEALALFRSRQKDIDCAVLDVEMPRLGGVEVMKEIKLMSPDIPVIFISGHSPGGDWSSSDLGASYFLSKDYTPLEMISLICETINTAPHTSEATAAGCTQAGAP